MRFRRTRYRAGESALAVWRRRRRQTIRRDWKLWSFIALATVVFATALFFTTGVGQLAFAAMLGGMVTVLYAGWQLGGDVRSLTWVWGQLGEQQTEDALRVLETQGWHVSHDIPNGHGNWDHIVVGPAGLFALETKTSDRKGSVRNDRLYLGRATYNGASFRASAKALHTALAEARPPFVQAVVVIWADFDASQLEERDVVYVGGNDLSRWLSERPARLSTTSSKNSPRP